MMFSIVVPVYNEENRIRPFLDSLCSFVKDNKVVFGMINNVSSFHECSYNIILVNDGSTDNSLKILREYEEKYDFIKILSFANNNGKGFAVQQGMLSSDSDLVLFIDADGSINPKQISDMITKLFEYDVVVGSRVLKDSVVEQSFFRRFTSFFFNVLVSLLFFCEYKDNLCGFKGFKKRFIKTLFSDLKSHKWVFDVELFYKIRKHHFSICYLPICWKHKNGSNIKFFTIIKILVELIKLRMKVGGKQKWCYIIKR